jgi:short-subunit dehydrogenase
MSREPGRQVIVITGATGGIGQATAIEFSKRGADLVLAGRSKDALENVRSRLAAPSRALAVSTDVTSWKSVQDLARSAVERFGRLDVWVNNAVVAMYGDFETVSLEDFRRVFETAFFGYVHGAAAALPYFREQRSGVLINVASVLGVIGIPHMSSYVAAKHAVVGFSEGLRQELTGTNIAVCTVLPGTVDTPFYDHAANFTGRKIHPLSPAFPPKQVANAIVRLAHQPRKQVFVPRTGALLPFLRAVAPGTSESVSARLINNFQIGEESAPPTEGNLYQPKHESRERGRSLAKVIGFGAAAAAASILLAARRKSRSDKAAA